MAHLQVAFMTGNGKYLVAENGGGRELLANRDAIGSWERFRLLNRSRPGQVPATGDKLVLQAWNGRLVAVGAGGGTVRADAVSLNAGTEFTIERVSGGTGAIRTGDQVALRSAGGHYVSAEGAGGAAVAASRTSRHPSGTFTIRFFQPQLIRLRTVNSRYVMADEASQGRLTAHRASAGPWKTFSVLNFSRADRTIHRGDMVALQAWNGRYVRLLDSNALDANARQASALELFTVGGSHDGPLANGDRVTLVAPNGLFVGVSNGAILADRRVVSDEARFMLVLAERAGLAMHRAPTDTTLTVRPRTSQHRRIFVIHVRGDNAPALSASNDEIARAVFGPRPSLADWYRTMSDGRFTISSAGVFGPVYVPNTRYTPWGEFWAAAEAQGVPLRSIASNGLIDAESVSMIRVGVGAAGQRTRIDVTSPGGVRYRGDTAGIGTSPDFDRGSCMLMAHETTHMFFDQVDRYHLPFPVRGDVVVSSRSAGFQETFVIERTDGGRTISSGDWVTMRAFDGKYLVASDGHGDFVNLSGSGDSRMFQIRPVASGSGGRVHSGTTVCFSSRSSRYMTAEEGGGSVLTANRRYVGKWEGFVIRKASGGGELSSGDRVSLQSFDGSYVVAQPGTADKWRDLGEWEKSAMHKWRDSEEGQGGHFDNATANYNTVLLSPLDRIRYGWVVPRMLTPDNRGSYVLRPFLRHREVLVLRDPQTPSEWYTVENRQRTAGVDEVPSSGAVVSWINEDQGYWQWWFDSARDNHAFDRRLRYPVVISAAAPTVPPNPLARPRTLVPELVYKRNHPDAAFREGEVILPLGNGAPSRFHLSFHPAPGNAVTVCIR